ncbi:hypothetical protein Clacol_007043 [Clathrus columnatus]|uniref:F-box domain-containing protein n=1 Tax=Clathrus columnatus TaxID=1419009 RepID=A0AAV5AH29_9AGAM|nr:hypothetical protein Clacol_007043 [Clathrus columnatus]
MPYPNGLPLDTIWDEIAYELDSPKDLLSLALTSRIFKDQIIPGHLEYRHIYCDLRRENVWTFLANHPRLARGIRSVELIDEIWDESHGNIRLPQILGDIPFHLDWLDDYDVLATDENMTMFRISLSHMTFLKKFIWQQQSPSIQRIIDVFHVLTHRTPCLEAFSIWSLTGLTKLVVHKPSIAVIRMLDLCPDIEDLSLQGLPSDSIVYLMQYVNLQKLRRLSLMTHSQERLIEALLKCSKLTHALCDFELHGSNRLNPHETLEPFSKRLSALKTLEYFGVILGHYEEKRLVKLERSEDLQYSGYRFVTVKEVGEDPECWGNLFVGL